MQTSIKPSQNFKPQNPKCQLIKNLAQNLKPENLKTTSKHLNCQHLKPSKPDTSIKPHAKPQTSNLKIKPPSTLNAICYYFDQNFSHKCFKPQNLAQKLNYNVKSSGPQNFVQNIKPQNLNISNLQNLTPQPSSLFLKP